MIKSQYVILSVLLTLLLVSFLGCADTSEEEGTPVLPDDEPWLNDSWTVLNPEPVGTPRTVRLIYFLPRNLEYRPEVVPWFRSTVREVQDFYAQAMDANGYGKLSFQVEKEVGGEFKVQRVLGGHNDAHYERCTFDTIEEELSQAFDLDANIYLVVIDSESRWIRNCGGTDVGGTGRSRGKTGGIGLVPEGVDWDLVAHELGHAFGLQHNFTDDSLMMSYGEQRTKLTLCYASLLSVHPYFNSSVPTKLTPPAIGLLPIQYESPDQVSIPVVTSSPVGLHHAMLYVMTMAPHEAAGSYELKECRLWGERPQEGFVPFLYDGVIPSSPNIGFAQAIKNPVVVSIVDADGNIREGEVAIPPPPAE